MVIELVAPKVLASLREYLTELEEYYAGRFDKQETQYAIHNLIVQLDRRIHENSSK